MNLELVHLDWEDLFSKYNTIEDKWISFTSVLQRLVDAYIPVCHFTNSHKNKLTNKVRKLCKKA